MTGWHVDSWRNFCFLKDKGATFDKGVPYAGRGKAFSAPVLLNQGFRLYLDPHGLYMYSSQPYLWMKKNFVLVIVQYFGKKKQFHHPVFCLYQKLCLLLFTETCHITLKN